MTQKRLESELRDNFMAGFVIRTAIAFLLFLLAFLLWVSGQRNLPLLMVGLLCTFEVLVNIPYYFLSRHAANLKFHFYRNITIDVLVITISIYFLGGLHAGFFLLLYPVVIIYAGVVLSYRDCFVFAALSSLCMITLVALQATGIVPLTSLPDRLTPNSQKVIMLLGYTIFFHAVAYLSGSLSDMIKSTRHSLIAAQHDLLRLEREKAEESARLAITDGLTGLYNHRYFQEQLVKEVQRAQRYSSSLSLIMGDVDHFKNFNDNYGHLQGDNVLRHVAAVLKAETRQTDVVARYGGDEFVVILPNAEKADALRMAENIRNRIRTELNSGQENKLLSAATISFGVASFPMDALTPMGLIQKADESLYGAKNGGRDRVVSI
ncbi:MAG TPA: GGDEF domain-containing protein [Nitrospiria bacterium]|jgi:diguanylate cyclase (GGDEF)-like protein|nr:GGDEF domain-containing protein [Nitrospiria bacterium]